MAREYYSFSKENASNIEFADAYIRNAMMYPDGIIKYSYLNFAFEHIEADLINQEAKRIEDKNSFNYSILQSAALKFKKALDSYRQTDDFLVKIPVSK